MTILDLQELREARRRADFDKWCTEMDGQLAAIERVVKLLTPLIEQWVAEQKSRPRGPRCEVPRCPDTGATLHPVRGRTPDDDPALVRICVAHEGAVRDGWLCCILAARPEVHVFSGAELDRRR